VGPRLKEVKADVEVKMNAAAKVAVGESERRKTLPSRQR
jgi:hypothetical protein